MTAHDYLATADVDTILDLIAAEFQSDPQSVACFDLRVVARAIELSVAWRGRHALPMRLRQYAEELLQSGGANVSALRADLLQAAERLERTP
jgi:hypothetical protein